MMADAKANATGGKVTLERVDCETCGGKGWIPVAPHDPGDPYDQCECQRCDGTGKMTAFGDCTYIPEEGRWLYEPEQCVVGYDPETGTRLEVDGTVTEMVPVAALAKLSDVLVNQGITACPAVFYADVDGMEWPCPQGCPDTKSMECDCPLDAETCWQTWALERATSTPPAAPQ